MIASSPCRPFRIDASVVVLGVALLGGCLAVRVGVVVVVAAVGGSLGTSSLTTLMAVLAADSYTVGGSSRLTPKIMNK
jgi:hypothetical protein